MFLFGPYHPAQSIIVTMQNLTEQRITCPYCGEPLNVLIDESGGSQEYIEDCQVCCQPIVFRLDESIDGDLSLSVFAENES